jgi:hypothetical protein
MTEPDDIDRMAELEREAGFTQEVDERLSGGGSLRPEQNVLQPSEKSPGMTHFLEQVAGRTSAIKRLTCIKSPLGCGREIDPGEVENWDPMTIREYQISGLCKTCQDSVFGKEE